MQCATRTVGPGPDAMADGSGSVGMIPASQMVRHAATCRVVDAEPGPATDTDTRAPLLQSRTREPSANAGVLHKWEPRGAPGGPPYARKAVTVVVAAAAILAPAFARRAY